MIFGYVSATQPVRAQAAAELSLQTDYRIRGYSRSSGQPALSLALSYDDRTGAYLGTSVTGAWVDDSPRLVAMQGYAGYAAQITPSVSVDAGVIQTHYSARDGFRGATNYTEFYLGALARHVSAHIFVSPDYNGTGLATFYAQVEGQVDLIDSLSLDLHVGHLAYLEQAPYYRIPARQDWRLALGRHSGSTNAFLALSGRLVDGDGQDTRIVAGISRSF